MSDHTVDVVLFQNTLKNWGAKHFRDFPWRYTRDPYRILIAEIMLHRTQAKQVLAIYERFIDQYPNVKALVKADLNELHSMLYSLGLRWRIASIYAMAKQLMKKYDGDVPQDRENLLALSGVSEYISSAVRCFAWNLPDVLLDTNTVRVAGRIFGLEIKDSSRRSKRFRDALSALLDKTEPRKYNYALLDLADKVCSKKRLPDCENCPVQQWCIYAKNKCCDRESGINEAI